MGKGYTQEEYENKVKEAIGDKYKVIGKYTRRSNPLEFYCNIHHINFTVTAECFMRGPNDVRGSCPQCAQEKRDKESPKVKVTCAYCGKEFLKAPSKLEGSKSGLYFCCREHKDLAQRIGSGEQFDAIRPDHYGSIENGGSEYRKIAFRKYPHKCSVCGWDEDEDILQVHHIDENRRNANDDNLIILCPTCHWKLTMKKYQLIGRDKIIKIE